MEKINEIVANNIAILRKKNRLSLEELGKLSGVSKSMLALIEKGDGTMKKTYKIEVDCANCANKMEEAAKKTAGVKTATVNFMTQKMIVSLRKNRM